MAVNKNFVVKNGLEVNDNLLVADQTSQKVGIGTSVSSYTLHVRGGIGATEARVTGVSTFVGDVHAESQLSVTGVTTLASAGGITTTGGDLYIGGEDGKGQNSGDGGRIILTGQLNSVAKFGSASPSSVLYPGDSNATGNEGGDSIPCTKGVYWAQQGKGACDDIGTGQFRLSDGTSVTNTTTAITRGYKAGYNCIQTAGKGTNNGGTGGNGATGGDGAATSAGGGGGSGYTDGSVTIVDTRLGGSTGDAKVVLRLQS